MRRSGPRHKDCAPSPREEKKQPTGGLEPPTPAVLCRLSYAGNWMQGMIRSPPRYGDALANKHTKKSCFGKADRQLVVNSGDSRPSSVAPIVSVCQNIVPAGSPITGSVGSLRGTGMSTAGFWLSMPGMGCGPEKAVPAALVFNWRDGPR